MPAIAADDPLWAVRDLINGDPCETLSPEQRAKTRKQMHDLLEMSPDQAAAAMYVARGIEQDRLVQLHHNTEQACMFFRYRTSPGLMTPPHPTTPTPPPADVSQTAGPSNASEGPSSTSPRRVAQLVDERTPRRVEYLTTTKSTHYTRSINDDEPNPR